MDFVSMGRITRVLKYCDQDTGIRTGVGIPGQAACNSNPRMNGSNGTYREFGEYRGTKMVLDFSLYDSEKFVINYRGRKYKLPSKFQFEIYEEVRRLFNVERVSNKIYSKLLKLRGTKMSAGFKILEENIVEDLYGRVTIVLDYILGLNENGKYVSGKIRVALIEVN